MAAEIYVTILTGFGLGHLLHYGRELNAMEQVIGVIIAIIAIGLLTDKILFSPIRTLPSQPLGHRLALSRRFLLAEMSAFG
jgi:ABC-type nitrate/sulfonate/bicarbonate transport system permease component